MSTCIYIYIERERDRDRLILYVCIVCTCIYKYIHDVYMIYHIHISYSYMNNCSIFSESFLVSPNNWDTKFGTFFFRNNNKLEMTWFEKNNRVFLCEARYPHKGHCYWEKRSTRIKMQLHDSKDLSQHGIYGTLKYYSCKHSSRAKLNKHRGSQLPLCHHCLHRVLCSPSEEDPMKFPPK